MAASDDDAARRISTELSASDRLKIGTSCARWFFSIFPAAETAAARTFSSGSSMRTKRASAYSFAGIPSAASDPMQVARRRGSASSSPPRSSDSAARPGSPAAPRACAAPRRAGAGPLLSASRRISTDVAAVKRRAIMRRAVSSGATGSASFFNIREAASSPNTPSERASGVSPCSLSMRKAAATRPGRTARARLPRRSATSATAWMVSSPPPSRSVPSSRLTSAARCRERACTAAPRTAASESSSRGIRRGTSLAAGKPALLSAETAEERTSGSLSASAPARASVAGFAPEPMRLRARAAPRRVASSSLPSAFASLGATASP